VRFTVTLGEETRSVEVMETGDAGRYRVRVDGHWLDVEAPGGAGNGGPLRLDGRAFFVDAVSEENGVVEVTLGADSFRLGVEEPGHARGRRGGRDTGAGQRLVAPMPGRVVAVHVAVGDRVEPGTPLIVLEAMKMENEFRAAAAGTVSEVVVSVGQAVNAGDLLVVVGPAAAA
jgi:3-methylcrotonyl-CoA carboxylase alpha subunit